MKTNKLRTINTLLFSLLLSLTLWAPSQAQAQVDPEAEKILKKVKNKVNGLKDISCGFKYTLFDRTTQKTVRVFQGTLKLKKGKYQVIMPDQQLFCDGTTTWNYRPAEKEVSIGNYDKDAYGVDKLFSFYQNEMKSRYDGSEAVNGVAATKITVFPVSSKLDYFKIEIWVEDNTSLPAKMSVWLRTGSVATYETFNTAVDKNIDDTAFTFNPASYPGVEVIDLR